MLVSFVSVLTPKVRGKFIDWTLLSVYIGFCNSGLLVYKCFPKISQRRLLHSYSRNHIFWIPRLILHKNGRSHFTPFVSVRKISHFTNLPKFAQIPNWWRHTGSCVCFHVTRPIFWTQRSFLRQNRSNKIFLQVIPSCFKSISLGRYALQKCPILAYVPQVTS